MSARGQAVAVAHHRWRARQRPPAGTPRSGCSRSRRCSSRRPGALVSPANRKVQRGPGRPDGGELAPVVNDAESRAAAPERAPETTVGMTSRALNALVQPRRRRERRPLPARRNDRAERDRNAALFDDRLHAGCVSVEGAGRQADGGGAGGGAGVASLRAGTALASRSCYPIRLAAARRGDPRCLRPSRSASMPSSANPPCARPAPERPRRRGARLAKPPPSPRPQAPRPTRPL